MLAQENLRKAPLFGNRCQWIMRVMTAWPSKWWINLPVCPEVMKAAAAVRKQRLAGPHSSPRWLWKQGVHHIVKSEGEKRVPVPHSLAEKNQMLTIYRSNGSLRNHHLQTLFSSHDVVRYNLYLYDMCRYSTTCLQMGQKSSLKYQCVDNSCKGKKA